MEQKGQNFLNRLPQIIKYLMVVGVILFISLLLPNNAKFKYFFELGQNWKYDNLVAPFDFPIIKTTEELASEYAAVEEQLNPYYNLDLDIAAKQIQAFETAFNTQLEQEKKEAQFNDVLKRPNVYLDFGKDYLQKIFKKGIIQIDDKLKERPKNFVIYIVENNSIYPETLGNLATVEAEKERLSDILPSSNLSEPEFLLPLLEKAIQVNLVFNEQITNREKDRIINSIPKARDLVKKGEPIINKNAPIDVDTYQKLVSFREKYQSEIAAKKSPWGVFSGYLILVSILIGVFLVYLLTYNKSVFDKLNHFSFILMWIVLYSYLVYFVEKTDIFNAYIIPFAIIPIVIKTFYNDQLALFVHIVVVLTASFLSSLGYEFTFLQIMVGVVVLLSDVNTRDWNRFFNSILYIFVTYALGFAGLSLIQEGNIRNMDWLVFSWLFLNVFFTMLSYPLIPLLERLFGFTSSITLVELANVSKPLLKELSQLAPGTFQHSLQVANLAEAAATQIGADATLVKTAALYHDIGKMKQPEYFIENQGGAQPHDELSPLDSARIIINHVTEGIEMAKKQRLPPILINFIPTHHGTTRVEYFFRKYQDDHPDEKIDESLFRYPGPKPVSKEETILMLADSIEAACKSLKSPTEKDLSELIEKIVNGKIANGQLVHSRLTFQELQECLKVFKQIMKSVHHVRIVYPEERVKE